jgi:bifunctional DNase/RNase
VRGVVRMELVGVRVEVPANTPIVVLREQDGTHRLLPIVIGTPEASSIHAALEGIESPRPLTHDLMVHVLERLGVTIDRVVVTEVRDHVFYAELHLTSAAGSEVVSSRPSDAIALAARTGTPLFASESLLLQAGQEPEVERSEADAEAILDEFRDFLDDLDPDDFKSP